MKKNLLFALVALFSTVQLWAADGDSFTAQTTEGVTMKFQVISEETKTCQVYGEYRNRHAVPIDITRNCDGTVRFR